MDELDGDELISRWIEQNRAYHFEGDSGLQKLEELVEVLGYRNTGFRFGTSLESFLSDNPGCQKTIVEWITEYVDRTPEWKERLEEEVEADEDDDDPSDPQSDDPLLDDPDPGQEGEE